MSPRTSLWMAAATISALAFSLAVPLLSSLGGSRAFAADKAEPPIPSNTTHSARESDLYRDDAGESVANVTQVLPNARETQTVIQNVRLITIRQGVLVIAHSESAVTLMPQQFVSNISVNKRLAEKK